MFSEEGTLQTNITGVRGECLQCLSHTGFAPAHSMCAFLDYTAQATGCSAGELSEAGPGMRALLRSMPLRFRFLGTPQRCRLGWARVLCPSQVPAAQATRCLASALSSGEVHLITFPVPVARFPRCARLWCAMCLFWGADLWLRPSQQMSTTQNLRKSLVRNWKPVHSLVGDVLSGAEFFPFWLWLAPACPLCLAGNGPVYRWLALLWYSLSPLFSEQAISALG